jgi:polyhydroxyalkanoate synthesis regulator phasin
MPYDLYGQYYASARDAENAEMAQCAEIDARHAEKKAEVLQQELYNEQSNSNNLWQYVQMLEERIKTLENKMNDCQT